MSDNWIINILEDALNMWNNRLNELFKLLTESPESFKGGGIWKVILEIHGTVKVIGTALLVLFFVAGVIKTCGSFAEIKRPEQVFKMFIRFVLSKTAVTYGLDLMLAVFAIVQGAISSITTGVGLANSQTMTLPDQIVKAVTELGFWESIPLWAVALIASLLIWVLSIVLILTVYGRFFKLYIYTAISPLPLAAFAGEPTAAIGRSFLRSYAGVCLEGAIIVIACIIYSAYAASPSAVSSSATAVSMVWSYVGELIFNMLVLVGLVKASDRLVKEMMGL